MCKHGGMDYRTCLRAAAISGGPGVALGAFGAHGLREILLRTGMSNAWETAVRYHLVHAVGLLCLSLWIRQESPVNERFFRWATNAWILGTLLFSGSLYGLALGGPRWLGPITPFGGVALILGWMFLLVAASRSTEHR